MALQLVPYNNSMRLGQGFNSFTQQICIDNAVVGISDPEDSQPLVPGTYAPIAEDGKPPLVLSSGTKKPLDQLLDDGSSTVIRYPSQIVTYTSNYVSKLSDVSNDLNVSGSLSIKYGEISGSGSGSYVNTETFQKSDLNFLVTVKVINQTIQIKDQLQFWPLGKKTAREYGATDFTKIYGDSFISGFQEGGMFSAIVSIKALDSSKLMEIKANAQIALQAGIGSGEAKADATFAKNELSKSSEINITVNWSGGGQIKANDQQWTIETLQDVSARFADAVAICPQRTHAILTKYVALRGYLQWRADAELKPLDYEIATLYTSELLDVYMGFKAIWKDIHEMLQDLEGADDEQDILVKATPTKKPVVLPDGEVLERYEPDYEGLDSALQKVRTLMVRIVAENDEVTDNPKIAVDPKRPIPYIHPQLFRRLLPVHAPTGLALNSSSRTGGGAVDVTVATGKRSSGIPDVLLGFQKLELERKNVLNVSIRLGLIERKRDSFKYHIFTDASNGKSTSPLMQQTACALSIPVNDQGVQAGLWTMPTRFVIPERSAGTTFAIVNQRINFNYAYETAPPNVVVFLAGFETSWFGPVNALASVSKIDNTGFDLQILAHDSLTEARVSWFACPADMPNVVCGTTNGPWWSGGPMGGGVRDLVSANVSLRPRTFLTTPKVFVAIRGFAVKSGEELVRIEANVLDVKRTGFTWKINPWADTKLIDGAVSWIAWQE